MTTALRDELRARLTAARRERDRVLTAALRSVLSALENAEAVPAGEGATPSGSAHVAGARSGVGAAEASRRTLTPAEERAVVRQEVEEMRAAATTYAGSGATEQAEGLVRAADVLDGLQA